MTPFFQLHRDLPREGPGTPEDVIWALDLAGTPDGAWICDAAAGPGADAATLAVQRPQARIVAVEKMAHFVREAEARLAGFGERVQVRQGDMAAPGGPFDLIWCAGGLYFLGVTEGLRSWRSALRPGARVAFSEPCFPGNPPSALAKAFWQDHPAATDLAGIAARVRAAGFHLLGHRMVIGAGWRAYYQPLEARITMLRLTADAALTAVLDAEQREIDLWRKAPDEIAYALLVVAPE
ncbi:MAG: class I SAM-dependent methyltransferase [Tabrizicola sp.]|nr:class I SAM-dependent methyltransferase [Tabrizicola sp.]